ncbi:hypothetical protein FRC07_010480 [Ceratobasidium sp. 392]|nr:hypothetical protein FRC07_010480 [Ceratobasidium sp. 392]
MSYDSFSTPSPLYADEGNENYFYYHEGRRMPAQGVYFLPADQEEFDRLESIHQMTTAVLGDLFWGPVNKKLAPRASGRRRCVLDVGAGTGSWVREMAEKYPQADFVGADIVPIPPPTSAISNYTSGSLLTTPHCGEYESSIYAGVRHAVSSENLTAMLLSAHDTADGSGTSTESTLLSPVDDYSTPASSPHSGYDTPHRTEVAFTERSNVRFEIHDLTRGLDYPDGVFDIVHCRYVLTMGVPGCKTAIRELLRVLRPGGLLLMAESSVPFSLSDGTDPPIGTATRELVEVVRASIKESGLDPDLRLKLASEVRSNPQVEKLDTCDFPLPLGDWPEDVSLQPIGRTGIENLAVGLRSLTPLLRQVGYDDAMMSMLASR